MQKKNKRKKVSEYDPIKLKERKKETSAGYCCKWVVEESPPSIVSDLTDVSRCKRILRVLVPVSFDIPNCFECDVNKPRKFRSRAKKYQKTAVRQIGIIGLWHRLYVFVIVDS